MVLDFENNLIEGYRTDPKDFPEVVRSLDFEDLKDMRHLGWGV